MMRIYSYHYCMLLTGRKEGRTLECQVSRADITTSKHICNIAEQHVILLVTPVPTLNVKI